MCQGLKNSPGNMKLGKFLILSVSGVGRHASSCQLLNVHEYMWQNVSLFH